MSRSVKLNCECGPLELRPEAVQVSRCETRTDLSRYVFCCPRCLVLRNRQACPATVAILEYAGVVVKTWSMPAKEVHTGPALTEDDHIAFGLALSRPDVAQELAA